MYQLGIFTGKDLKEKTEEYLETNFGKSGKQYYYLVRGISNSPVTPERNVKSVAAERTFDENITSEIYVTERLENIATELEKRLQKNKLAGKTITLKIKYSDFTMQTRSKTLSYFVSSKSLLLQVATELLYQERLKESVRLVGISLSHLNNEERKSIAVQLAFEF